MKKKILSAFILIILSTNLFSQSENVKIWYWNGLDFYVFVPTKMKIKIAFREEDYSIVGLEGRCFEPVMNLFSIMMKTPESEVPSITEMAKKLFNDYPEVQFELKKRVEIDSGMFNGFYVKGKYQGKDAYISVVKDNMETMAVGVVTTYSDDFTERIAIEVVQSVGR